MEEGLASVSDEASRGRAGLAVEGLRILGMGLILGVLLLEPAEGVLTLL